MNLVMKPHFITAANRHLYWALGLAGTAWVIGMVIFKVTRLVVPPTKETPVPTILKPWQQSESETSFRNYLSDQPREEQLDYLYPSPASQLPAELPLDTVQHTSSVFLKIADTSIMLKDASITGPTWTLATGPWQLIKAAMINEVIVAAYQTKVTPSSPCPLPFAAISVSCPSIWHHPEVIGDSVYLFVSINPTNGQVNRSMSFLVPRDQTGVWLTETGIFLTAPKRLDWLDVYLAPETTWISPEVKLRLQQIRDSSWGEAAKQLESNQVLAQVTHNMSDTERLQWVAKRDSQQSTYLTQQNHQLEQSVITKIDPASFTIERIGLLPGTVRSLTASSESVYVATRFNDLTTDFYTLNPGLEVQHSQIRLAKQRLRSIQFSNSRAYLANYVDDQVAIVDLMSLKLLATVSLTNPYPVEDNRIISVMPDGNRTTLVLYGMDDSAQPKELSRVELPEPWTGNYLDQMVLGTAQSFYEISIVKDRLSLTPIAGTITP